MVFREQTASWLAGWPTDQPTVPLKRSERFEAGRFDEPHRRYPRSWGERREGDSRMPAGGRRGKIFALLAGA